MASYTSKDRVVKLEDPITSVLTDISNQVNSHSFSAALTILDDSGYGDGAHSVISGMTQAQTFTLNGRSNSTTRTLFQDVILGNSTARAARTFAIGRSGYYKTAEVYLSNYQESGDTDTVETWSLDIAVQSVVSETSVEP